MNLGKARETASRRFLADRVLRTNQGVSLCETFRERSPLKLLVMKLSILCETRGGVSGGRFSAKFFPGDIGIKFVTENFTTFSTGRKEIVTWTSLWGLLGVF